MRTRVKRKWPSPKYRRWWVPELPDLWMTCASGARTKRGPAERQAKALAKDYRHVTLVRVEGRGHNAKRIVVLTLRDGKVVANG